MSLPNIIVQAKLWLMKPEEALAYEASLWRAFIRDGADYIVLDSNWRGQRFLAAGVAWGVDNEILFHASTDDSDEQCEVYAFRLTEHGRTRLTERESILRDVR